MDLTYMRSFLLCLPFISTLTYAAQIKFPEELIPLQVGENVIEHSLFSKVDEITLNEGVHKLKIKYSDLFELDYDDHEVVESKPFWIEIQISENVNYQVIFNKPEDEIEAQAFAKSPSVTLKAISTGELVAVTKSSEPEKKVVAVNVTDVKPSPKALEMLNFWWQQASKQEKERFLHDVKNKGN